MSNTPKPGAVLFTKDIKRVSRFYEEVLQLPVTHSESDHIVLESEEVQLVIHALPDHIASAVSISELPALRDETPIKLFFPVPSLEKARGRASQLGGHLGSSTKEWEADGFRACDGYDPEGNVFQLRQSVP